MEPLDFGAAAASPVVDLAQRYPHQGWAIAAFGVYVAVGCWIVWRLIRKAPSWTPPVPVGHWPSAAKALVALTMISFALVHVFALLEVYLQSRKSFSSAEEYFFYMSPAKLAASSHAHFFGHAVMYGVTGAVFLWTAVGEPWKTAVIALTLAGGLLDTPAWWMIKFAGGGFEAFSILAAILSSGGWTIMSGRIFYEMFILRK